MKQFSLIIFLLTLLVSCNTSEQVLIINEAYTPTSETEIEYKIESHRLDGDSLTLYVEYNGKCRNHKFELISNGMYLKSNPPKLHLNLTHIHNTKSCNEPVKDSVSFDISSAQYWDNGEENVVTLILSGYNKPIKYDY